jgi:hypothetical protein
VAAAELVQRRSLDPFHNQVRRLGLTGDGLAGGMGRRAGEDLVQRDDVARPDVTKQRRLILPAPPVVVGRPAGWRAGRRPELLDRQGQRRL